MESSTVSGSILMIEETVGRLRVSTCLYIFSSLSFQWPRMGDTVILPFLNEHWTNNRLYIREGDENHGHENTHPTVCSAVLLKVKHKREV